MHDITQDVLELLQNYFLPKYTHFLKCLPTRVRVGKRKFFKRKKKIIIIINKVTYCMHVDALPLWVE